MNGSDRAPGLVLGEGVTLPDSVVLGAHVVIHPGTVVGEGVVIQDGAVLGKPLAIGAASTAPRDPLPPLVVGGGAVIGTGAVVLAGSRLGERAVVADQAHVRERTTVGGDTVIGRGASVENDVTIGARVKLQTNAYVTAYSVVEDDVFVAPNVTTANDHAMGRHEPGATIVGPILRRACRVGAAAIVLPGIEVGEEAFIAAGALVNRDVLPRAVVMGLPGRAVRQVFDEDLRERWP